MKRIKYIHVFSSAVTAFLIAVTTLFTAGCVDGTRKQLSDCISSIQAIPYSELSAWSLHYEGGKSYYLVSTVLDSLRLLAQAPLTRNGATIDKERLRYIRINDYSNEDGQLFSDLADSLSGFLHAEILSHAQWALDNEIMDLTSNEGFCRFILWGRPYGKIKEICFYALPNPDGTIKISKTNDEYWEKY